VLAAYNPYIMGRDGTDFGFCGKGLISRVGAVR